MDKDMLLAMGKLLDEKLEPIHQKLGEHTQILEKQGRILEEHTEILEKQGQILEEHTQILEKQERILEEHTRILEEHGQILKEHTQTLEEHTQILRALEHASQVNKAEHDQMMNDIIYIKRDLSRVEEATAQNWVDIAKLKQAK